MENYDYDVAHDMSGSDVGGFNIQLGIKDKQNNNNLPKGVCRRCEGYSPGFGPCRNGITGVTIQDGFGEVRCGICSRCSGTGIEPPIRVFNGRWYLPWTWFEHHYE